MQEVWCSSSPRTQRPTTTVHQIVLSRKRRPHFSTLQTIFRESVTQLHLHTLIHFCLNATHTCTFTQKSATHATTCTLQTISVKVSHTTSCTLQTISVKESHTTTCTFTQKSATHATTCTLQTISVRVSHLHLHTPN
jgi:hypothetical protein